MLTRRVPGSGSVTQVRLMFHDAELLIAYPPPLTPNLPPTVGSASTASAALPPLRFRSRPQPQRISAGEVAAYQRARSAMAPASTPETSAARSKVHSAARFLSAS